MKLYQIGFILVIFSFLSPVFANQCPRANDVRRCSGDHCFYQRFAGWSNNIYYMDKGKTFTFQKARTEHTRRGTQISCFYTYLKPETNTPMPPAVMLRTLIN